MNTHSQLRVPRTALGAGPLVRLRPAGDARPAFTLIELLIVVIIVLSLTAIAIPLLVPSQDNRRMLESSRIVTGALARARSMAIETRRPAGVVLERQVGLPEACFQISFAEVPAPYGGGVSDARIHIGELGDLNNNMMVDAPDEDWNGDGGFFTPGLVWAITDAFGNPDFTWQGLVKPGDQLRLNYQGELYTIYTSNVSLTAPVNVNTDGTIAALDRPTNYWVLIDSSGNLANVRTPAPVDYDGDGLFTGPGEGGGLPFQIIRQPYAASSVGAPVQLPATVAINLAESDADGIVLSDYAPGNITILFSPGGSVQSIRWAGTPGVATSVPAPYVPSSPIFLMLSKRELIPLNPAPAAGEPTYSFQDLGSRWVGVNHTSGMPSSAAPAALDPALPFGTFAEKWARIQETRQPLRENRQQGIE
jgi:prepilin-type N-terminal cleavage/methylation domain-containing protein